MTRLSTSAFFLFALGAGVLMAGCDAFLWRSSCRNNIEPDSNTRGLYLQHVRRATSPLPGRSQAQRLYRFSDITADRRRRYPVSPGWHLPRAFHSAVLTLGATSGGGDDGMKENPEVLSRQAKLWISIMIDLIGVASYALPGLGEVTDLGWAPISSALVYYLYGNSVFAGLAFVEEIIPGFDIIPTATIAWFLTNSEVGKNVSNVASGNTADNSKNTARSSASSPSKTTSGTASGKRRGVVNRDEVSSGVVVDVESE